MVNFPSNTRQFAVNTPKKTTSNPVANFVYKNFRQIYSELKSFFDKIASVFVKSGAIMSFIALMLLAFAMSMDAFAVALAKGTTIAQHRFGQLFKIALLFAIVESITPVIGWAIGSFAEQWIESFDHWIAFILLCGMGCKALYDALFGDDDNADNATQNTAPKIWLWLATAFGTSIDAMAIGVSFAFLQINIWLASLMIGLSTLIMSLLGLHLGRRLGKKFGNYAEALGGITLIIIGCYILIDHLS